MTIEIHMKNQVPIAVIATSEPIIHDSQSALDLIMSISYMHDARHIVFPKAAFTNDFFDLKTKIAGDIIQKMVTYQFKFAIIGDFSNTNSKALNDFIYESNAGNQYFFLGSTQLAIDRLSQI